jgi:hypothetical protein
MELLNDSPSAEKNPLLIHELLQLVPLLLCEDHARNAATF